MREIGKINDNVRELLERELPDIARDIDKENRIPSSFIQKLRDAGAFDPKDIRELLEMVRISSRSSPAVGHLILINGTAKLLLGKNLKRSIIAVSITEPGGGSDVKANLNTKALNVGEKIYINGTKFFTSNALYADHFLVLAASDKGPTLFLLRKSENVIVEPMDLTAMRGAGISVVHYNNAPVEMVIGEEGTGLRNALLSINMGRLGYSVIALGIAEGLLLETIKYMKERIVFGRSLIEHQGPRWMIAELYSKIELLRSYIDDIVKDDKNIDPLKASIAKVEGARLAQEAAWVAVQLKGGRGLEKGSLTERLSRDARALDIGEGAREVLLDFIGHKVSKIF